MRKWVSEAHTIDVQAVCMGKICSIFWQSKFQIFCINLVLQYHVEKRKKS